MVHQQVSRVFIICKQTRWGVCHYWSTFGLNCCDMCEVQLVFRDGLPRTFAIVNVVAESLIDEHASGLQGK